MHWQSLAEFNSGLNTAGLNVVNLYWFNLKFQIIYKNIEYICMPRIEFLIYLSLIKNIYYIFQGLRLENQKVG